MRAEIKHSSKTALQAQGLANCYSSFTALAYSFGSYWALPYFA